jgi:hypothetical protein
MSGRLRNLLLALLLFPIALCASDPFAGTWKLNRDKSKEAADMPRLPQSETIVVEATDGGQKVTNDQITAKGKNQHFEYDAKYDGKGYPETGNPNVDTVSIKKVNDHTMLTTNTKDGKLVTTIKSVVSKDGKTRTSTLTTKNEKGESVSWTGYFEKQ